MTAVLLPVLRFEGTVASFRTSDIVPIEQHLTPLPISFGLYPHIGGVFTLGPTTDFNVHHYKTGLGDLYGGMVGTH